MTPTFRAPRPMPELGSDLGQARLCALALNASRGALQSPASAPSLLHLAATAPQPCLLVRAAAPPEKPIVLGS
jgi:hypothetical protein